ncbi:hypothetical protein PV708_02815 [Streptomyces sp. ME02-6977A]|uniref:hypothetical protein n=1 Tax=Streptomyces sp. ME02-6977A TaxID=3028671 RepID=UPI0029BE4676|nr:hypothetical protein [Streptomyces sp. ME02-6977A]MDX3405169.1 hypothetical protein [Streptomyces sp. ME02-6977A]
MEHFSGVGPDGWRGAGVFAPPDELITLSVDYGDEDYHIDAKPGHRPADMRIVLAQARARGLEPMDADECEPELLEDGTVRIYLVLAEPVEQPAPGPVVSLQEKRRQSSAKRMTLAFAIAASVAAAILLPSPLRFDYIPNQKDRAEPAEHHVTDVKPIIVPAKGN